MPVLPISAARPSSAGGESFVQQHGPIVFQRALTARHRQTRASATAIVRLRDAGAPTL
jgi:hypothetical protein